MAKKYVFFPAPSCCLSLSFLSSVLPGWLSCWQELSSEGSLQQETAVTPHQTSSKPRGPWWCHSWVDEHDHSLLTVKINHPPSPPAIFAVLLLISVPWPLSVFPPRLVSCACTCRSAQAHDVVLSQNKADRYQINTTTGSFSIEGFSL